MLRNALLNNSEGLTLTSCQDHLPSAAAACYAWPGSQERVCAIATSAAHEKSAIATSAAPSYMLRARARQRVPSLHRVFRLTLGFRPDIRGRHVSEGSELAEPHRMKHPR